MSVVLRHEERARAAAKRLAGGDAAEPPMQDVLRGPQEPQRPPTSLIPPRARREEPHVSRQAVSQEHFSGSVFSINFVRSQTLSLRVRRLLTSLALGYIVANLFALTGLLGTALYAHTQRQRFAQSIPGGTTPSIRAVGAGQDDMEIHRRAQADLAELGAIVAQQKLRLPVGGKLAALTKTLPARTWLTGISGTRAERRITVQATYLIDPERPYELPIKAWMGALRDDPAFRDGLTRLELSASSRKTQGRAELALFELVAEWQPLADR